jgi:hypothetical protein
MKNGDIAFGAFYNLYILDNKTLTIKQEFIAASRYEYVLNMQSYFSPGESKFIVTKQLNFIYEYIKQDDGTYTEKILFYIDWYANANFVLTGMNSGVSTSPKKCEAQYWTNLNSIIEASTDPKFCVYDRSLVAVSNNEKLYVTMNTSNHYEIYALDEEYDINLTSIIFINKDTLRKSAFTSDD